MNEPIIPKYFKVVKSNNFVVDVWFITVKRSDTIEHKDGTFRLVHGIDHFEFEVGRGYDNERKMEFFSFKVDQTDVSGRHYVEVGIPNPNDHLTLIESINPGEYTVALIPKNQKN